MRSQNRILIGVAGVFFASAFASGCQDKKSDLQACSDAQYADYKAHPKKEDGTWDTFWDEGRFDETSSRRVAFEICGHILKN